MPPDVGRETHLRKFARQATMSNIDRRSLLDRASSIMVVSRFRLREIRSAIEQPVRVLVAVGCGAGYRGIEGEAFGFQ